MLPLVLLLGFIVVPVLEIYVIVRVGLLIGVVPTVILLLAESVLGAWLVKREGIRAWRTLREAIGTGRLPSRQLADAALVLIGGTLLLTPGFLTDIIGFAFVLPLTRPIARRILAWMLMSRMFASTRLGRAVAAARNGRVSTSRYAPGQPQQRAQQPAQQPAQHAPPARRVVPGEIVEEDNGAPGV